VKVRIDPTEDYRTELPVNMFITETEGAPKVKVKGIGAIPVEKRNDFYYSQFYVQIPGTFNLTIQDSRDTFTKDITFAQQEYLSFGKQFGAFMVLFAFAMIGLVLWTKKIMNKKTEKTLS
jgi:hypothetical protein